MENFKEGDVVTLNVGNGPKMTIEKLEEETVGPMSIELPTEKTGKIIAHCVWFDGKKMIKDKFYTSALKPAKPNDNKIRIVSL